MKAILAHQKYNELIENIEGSESVELEDWNEFFQTAEETSMETIVKEKQTSKLIMKVMIEVIQELLIKQNKTQSNGVH